MDILVVIVFAIIAILFSYIIFDYARITSKGISEEVDEEYKEKEEQLDSEFENEGVE